MTDPIVDRHWTPEQKAEFVRRRRGRNWALLGTLVALCLLIYAIAVVKLLHSGHMW
ncbi:hypothetical protein AiwAL_11170 [Acidiphilium sp. AL]|uniref:hypothetical protein n=1 Tax=Acidiphilium sp. AL TaxID=2871704 RepID=UPI0021CB4D0A|nr:hypothetical protein [Acidiphilium sp. AL]MCU4160662.1 hypothetical protein [Acidiphilium sp. AL]